VSGRTFADVLKAFPGEAERAFGFLVGEFGLDGPEKQDVVLPSVTFVGPPLRYRILLDPDDKAVSTRIETDLNGVRLVGELEKLISAARLGSGAQIAYSANNLRNLRRALESQAGFVRALHPLMTADGGVDLMRKAHAREWHLR
jgi:hypothetical protein